jgi:hypothetical protein
MEIREPAPLARESAPTRAPGDPSGPEDSTVIILPLFNDWPALHLLLADLDSALAREGRTARILVVDDGSTTPGGESLSGRDFAALRRIDILTLRRNLGHQRAIAIGLAYVEGNIPCRSVVVMDSDGEDAPGDVPRLLAEFDEVGESKIIFAERTRRSESWVFILFYGLYRFSHRLLTGYSVRVGNFSVIPRKQLASLVVVSEIWNHYPAAVFRSVQPYGSIPTRRAKRLSGSSKMNFVRLVIHGLSALSVYSDIMGVRLLLASLVMIVLSLAGLFATVLVRLATSLAVPGWATTAFGALLVLLLQSVMLSVAFSFMILSGRQGASFLPCRDYAYYVGDVKTMYRAS